MKSARLLRAAHPKPFHAENIYNCFTGLQDKGQDTGIASDQVWRKFWKD